MIFTDTPTLVSGIFLVKLSWKTPLARKKEEQKLKGKRRREKEKENIKQSYENGLFRTDQGSEKGDFFY